MNDPIRTLLIIFFAAILAAMLWVTISASQVESVADVLDDAWNDLWWRATLADAYFGFLTVWIWIAWREAGWGRAAAWLVALLLLGNIAIAIYFLIVLARLPPGASWQAIFRRRDGRPPAATFTEVASRVAGGSSAGGRG